MTTIQAVLDVGRRFVFSDGHGIAAFTKWFDDLARLDQVDWHMVYGLELLSSVHWLATHADRPSEDAQDAANGLAAWNDRKRRMFRPEHIPVAWDRLASENWIAA